MGSDDTGTAVRMKFWSAASLEHAPDAIAADLRDQVQAGDEVLDLAVAFVRPPDSASITPIIEAVRQAIPARRFLACTAESVVAAGREIEDEAATALLVGSMPGVQIDPLPDLAALLKDGEAAAAQLRGAAAVIALVDPFTVQTEQLAERMNELAPGVPLIGGVASWAHSAGENRLANDEAITDRGVVGVALRGAVDVSVVVSQGCRPVGSPRTVTAVRGNIISQLDGERPLDVLRQVFSEAAEKDQELMRTGVMLGHAISSDERDLGRGGFLIRGLMGADAGSGALAVTGSVSLNDTVQFHVRDAATAQEDLELLLTPQAFESEAAGALLFTCNGRGARMYGRPDGDISMIRQALGSTVPVSGFFCGGELGPIGGANFVHGYTASLVIFRPKAS